MGNSTNPKKPRGRPFVKGDARINREGLSKEKAELREKTQELNRQLALQVLGESLPVGDKVDAEGKPAEWAPTALLIYRAIAAKALLGSLEHGKFLLDQADYLKAPQMNEVALPDGGRIIFDIPGPEREREAEKAN